MVMTTTAEAWTPAHVASIAPDKRVAAAGLTLSTTGAWTGVGHCGDLLWGKCRSSGKKIYQVCADVSAPAFHCSCLSRKSPCKHILGLLHLWCDGRAGEEEPANFVLRWAQRLENSKYRAAEAAKATESAEATGATGATGATESAESAEAAARASSTSGSNRRPANARTSHGEQRITDGLDELDRWMADQVEQGIAASGEELPTALRRLAARMVDAQAPALATRLTELAELAELTETTETAETATGGDKDPDWVQTATDELGIIHLLVRAWRERTHLPPDLVTAMRHQLGMSVRTEAVLTEPEVKDHWVVVGSQDRSEGRGMARHSWLYGRKTDRWARVTAYARERDELPRTYTAGTQVEARLHFYPGDSLRALSRQEYPSTGAVTGWTPTPAPITGARKAWRDALSADPWAEVLPAIVAGRLAIDEAGHLALTDRSSMLPLTGRAEQHRRLALSIASDDAVVAGLLSPKGLQPLSLVTGGTVVPL